MSSCIRTAESDVPVRMRSSVHPKFIENGADQRQGEQYKK